MYHNEKKMSQRTTRTMCCGVKWLSQFVFFVVVTSVVVVVVSSSSSAVALTCMQFNTLTVYSNIERFQS